ncbi:MAG: hypothetical protein ACI9JZ_000898 [Lentimonas sp.]|jgi:hypothetical protein
MCFVIFYVTMKGLVFTEFIEMVETKFGYEVLDRLTSLPSLKNHGAYTTVGNYPHGEMLKMLDELHGAVGLPHRELILVFAEWLFGAFIKVHPEFFERIDNSFDFLNGIETMIHSEVRRLYPDARLPDFECERRSETELVMDYSSWRPFADLAEGLIRASSKYFNEEIEVIREDGPLADGRSARFTLKKLN